MTPTALACFAAVLLAAPLAWAQAPARPAPAPAPAQARPAVSGEMVTEANLSRDGLKAAFDAAKMTTAIDAVGNLSVAFPQVRVNVVPAKDVVRLLVSFSFAPRAAMQERLDLANRINDGYIMVRAAVPAERPGELSVDHYIVLGPGVSRAAIAAATRRFADVVVEAVGALDTDNLLK
jgi:hypothetical protein